VAAVIIVNAEATAQTPAPADTPAAAPAAPAALVAPAAIGEPSKARAQTAVPVDPNQDGAPAQDIAGDAPGAQAPAGNNEDAAAKPASASALAAANTTDAGSQPPALVQGSDDGAVPAPAEANAANGTGHANAPAAAPSTLSSSTGASSGQSASGAAKVSADGLPNFGFAVATAAAQSAPATIAAPASTAAIPIAGLAVAIAARAQSGSNQFEIRLDPPELGRIDVHLDVDRDGQVTSHVTADRADTLALLQSQQPQLERALEQAGLKTTDNGLQFTLRDQSFAGQNNGGGGSQPLVAQLVIPDNNLAPVDATQIYTRAGPGSGLDIRV
jgi:flagellar hook-length control protein FliK